MPSIVGRAWAVSAFMAGPALRIMLVRRARRGREIPARLAERRGVDATPRPAGRLLWVHAASVGEAVSVLPVLAALPSGVTVLLTTGTVTSARLLEARLPAMGLQERVLHRFVPLDVPSWAARFLDHWRPDAACFLESELWPNLLTACAGRGIGVALVNARLSVRSAARWQLAGAFAREVLGHFTWIAAQSDEDAARLRALGGREVWSAGNLKFAAPDLPVDEAELTRLRVLFGDRPRWLAASTHAGDEAMVLRIHRTLASSHPGLVTAVAPRHPERGAALAAELGDVPRRSLGQDVGKGGVWIADTLGELGLLYRAFPIVFMGKSFPPGGGQNPWEPARLGCAVGCGPAMRNFGESVERLSAAGALQVMEDEAALENWVGALLNDGSLVESMSAAATEATRGLGDLPQRLAAMLIDLMDRARIAR